MHQVSRPFAFSRGSIPNKIMFVAEAWGTSENKIKRPLVGASGREFARMLIETGFISTPYPDKTDKDGNHSSLTPTELDSWWNQTSIFQTNVLPFQPDANNLVNICGTKIQVGGKKYLHPPIRTGAAGPKYLLPEYLPELDRLAEEIKQVNPNIIIALGNVAAWALLNRTGITSIRGTTAECTLVGGYKVLPTFHPSNILRQWENRTIMLADLIKAKRESEFSEIRRPEREILVDPTITEIYNYIQFMNFTQTQLLSIDIETKNKTITMISFSYSPKFSLVIPFHAPHKKDGNYWESAEDEVTAWEMVGTLLHCDIPKLFQNGLYDITYLFRAGFRPKNCHQDTMLLHHAMLPEMQKGLGFLGSLYTYESSWKLMRRVRAKEQSNKSDE
jgi:uracil-DNA glycosylase